MQLVVSGPHVALRAPSRVLVHFLVLVAGVVDRFGNAASACLRQTGSPNNLLQKCKMEPERVFPVYRAVGGGRARERFKGLLDVRVSQPTNVRRRQVTTRDNNILCV